MRQGRNNNIIMRNNFSEVRYNRLLIILSIFATLFIISYFIIYQYSFYFGTPLPQQPFSYTPGTVFLKSKHKIRENLYYNDNRTAFVFGATGTYARTELFKCMTAIESLGIPYSKSFLLSLDS
jgi:hypothetical protein